MSILFRENRIGLTRSLIFRGPHFESDAVLAASLDGVHQSIRPLEQFLRRNNVFQTSDNAGAERKRPTVRAHLFEQQRANLF